MICGLAGNIADLLQPKVTPILVVTRSRWKLRFGTKNPSLTVWEPPKKLTPYSFPKELKKAMEKERLKAGLAEIKKEIIKWKDEQKERILCDPLLVLHHRDYEYVWKFDSRESLENWIASSDKDHKIGKSEAKLDLSPTKKALFYGTLNCDPPTDGVHKISGFANIKCIRAYKSFKRDTTLDWSMYTHLLMRIRGDGRSYMLNIHTAGYFDVKWHDMYQYVLFTRGGPYWQLVKIPFSKFLLSFKGRVQDKQTPIPLSFITAFGITLMDKIPGNFSLEVDYIGLYFDANHTEEFAYEMYKTKPFVAGI